MPSSPANEIINIIFARCDSHAAMHRSASQCSRHCPLREATGVLLCFSMNVKTLLSLDESAASTLNSPAASGPEVTPFLSKGAYKDNEQKSLPGLCHCSDTDHWSFHGIAFFSRFLP